MSSNKSGNKGQKVNFNESVQNWTINDGSSSTKRHSAVNNPVPGKGGKGTDKGGKK